MKVSLWFDLINKNKGKNKECQYLKQIQETESIRKRANSEIRMIYCMSKK